MDRLGRALTSAVTTYNQTVGSLESRVLVSARKLNQLGVVEGDLETPVFIEEATRALAAPELAAPELPVPELPVPELPVPELPVPELPVPLQPDAPELAVSPQPDPRETGRLSPERPEISSADGSPGAVMAIPGSNGAS
jgi:DNA recombination protein RmuC